MEQNGINANITMAGIDMTVLAVGDAEMLTRPCVDCGLVTGRFCDYCYAKDRVPSEEWAEGQLTPLCSTCDWKFGMCHFCKGLVWCVPPTRRS